MELTEQNSMPQWLVIGFSGHRHLRDKDLIARSISRELSELKSSYHDIATISSAASGGDTLFLKTADEIGAPLQVILPFDKDRFRADFSETDWESVKPYIDKAIRTTTVDSGETAGEAYLDSGIITADCCDVLITVWNGKPAEGIGGTENIVAYARHLEKPLLIIDEETGDSRWENRNSLPKRDINNSCNDEHNAPQTKLQNTLENLDSLATRAGPLARNIGAIVLLLHLVACTISITSLIFAEHLPYWVNLGSIASKVIFLIAALFLVFKLHSIHHDWTGNRTRTEMHRLFAGIWQLPPPSESLTSLSVRGQDKLVRNLEISWRTDRPSHTDNLDTAKSRFLVNRVEDQVRYFKKELHKAVLFQKLIIPLANISTFLAIIAALLALGLSIYHHQMHTDYALTYYVGKWASVVLPLLSAALLSFAFTHDIHRRVGRYMELLTVLEDAKFRVNSAVTWAGLWRAVFALERQLSNELQEWNTMAVVTAKSH